MKIEKGSRVKGQGLRRIAMLMVIACAVVLVSVPAFAEIVLEIHSNTTNGETSFTDSSNTPHDITRSGGAIHSDGVSNGVTPKFGTSSMFFDGDGDYLLIDDHADWYFDTGDFTIDFWAYSLDTGATVNRSIIGQTVDNDNRRHIYFDNGNTLRFNSRFGGATEDMTTGGTISQDTWHHIAFVRNGDNFNFYHDGNPVSSTVSSNALNDLNASLAIGGNGFIGTGDFYGYLDDLYIRKGEALEQYQIVSIATLGGEVFEDDMTQRRQEMTSALNNGGVNELALGYTESEINELADLYEDANGGLSPADVVIGDLTWSYVSGTLPGDTGGTTYNIGDAYMHDGKWYMKLGSGLEGVPEMPPGAMLFMAMVFGIGTAVRRRRKKLVRSLL